MSADTSAPIERPTAREMPGQTTKHAAWISVAVTGLVIGTVFISLFVGLQRAPVPSHLPLAVTGTTLAAAARDALGDRADVSAVDSEAEGLASVRRGDTVASLSVSDGSLHVAYAGARGLSESSAARALATGLAESSGLEVSEDDVVPLSPFDSKGLVSFYVTFGVALASFILGQGLTGAAGRVRLRHRLLVTAAFAVVIGSVAATVVGTIYDALPAPWPLLAVTLVLLSAACALTTEALGAWLGAAGIGIAVLLLTTTGNALSSATIGQDLLPSWAQFLSPALPAGAAVRAVTDFGYFSPSDALTSLLVLVGWAAVGLALITVKASRTRRRAVAHTPAHVAGS